MQQFVCACGYEGDFQYPERIRIHMKTCQEFNQQSPLSKMLRQIKQLTLSQIMTLKIDLQCQLEKVDKELEERAPKPLPQEVLQFSPENFHYERMEQKLPCEVCRKLFSPDADLNKIWYLESCCHLLCRLCISQIVFKDYIMNDGKVLCREPGCGMKLTEQDIIQVIGINKFQELDQKLAMKHQNIVSCVKCQQMYSFEKGNNTEFIKDSQGKQLTGELLREYIENRFICQDDKCKLEQCRNCQAHPFHLGFTCEEFKKKQNSLKCRLCDQVVLGRDLTKPRAVQEICGSQECQTRAEQLCKKTLMCGHYCQGFKDEKQCLPCLQEGCVKLNPQLNQNIDDFCNVCFTEGLRSAPCIKAACGHIYHYECVLKRIETRWNGPRIVFNFLACPLCKQDMIFPNEFKQITSLIEKALELKADVVSNAIERLEMESRDKDKELSDPKHQFYKKPIEYAMAIFCFYECFKCKKPYFGGLKSCQNNMEDQQREFNKSDLICSDCCPISFENKCKKHGTKYIEFKCRFCCSAAVWFCFGTTHFCEPCHNMAGRNEIKVCKGYEYCPLKVKHAPNGEECSLGCAVCRQRRIDEIK